MRFVILVTLTFVILSAPTSGLTQVNGKIISVKGESTQEVQASGVYLNLELTEIKANEYQKIRAKEISEIEQDLLKLIGEMGYFEKDLIPEFPKQYSHNRNKQIRYNLIVQKIEEVQKIILAGVKGLKVSDANYIFPDPAGIDTATLSEKALDDARQKAQMLAKQVGKKVGKIVSVSDQNRDLNRINSRDKNESYTVLYALNVTFELKD